jgi:serine/threonine protein kinase
MFENLSLSDISPDRCIAVRKPTNTGPAIWRIEDNGRTAIVKDFRYNGFIYRNIIGRFLIWREAKAYRKLKGLKGVPVFYGSLGGITLVVEEIKGTDIEKLEVISSLSNIFYRELKDLIKEIHKRGLVHCDLKRAPNIMLGIDGRPYIVDWASAISKREFRFFHMNLIYDRFIIDDLNAVTKLRLKYQPEKVSREDRDLYMKRGRVERLVRRVKDWFKDSLKKIA